MNQAILSIDQVNDVEVMRYILFFQTFIFYTSSWNERLNEDFIVCVCVCLCEFFFQW